MHVRTRRLLAVVATLGLSVGLLTVTAGSASAVSGAAPRYVAGYGYYKGYVIEWEEPDGADPTLLGYVTTLYLASDLTSPVQGRYVDRDGLEDNGDLYAFWDNLTPGTKYVATVKADWLEDDSVAVKADEDYAYTFIGKPAAAAVKVSGKYGLSVSWKPPVTSNATGPVLDYVVLVNGGSPTYVAPTARSVRLTGLTAGRRYTLQVLAEAPAGDGARATAYGTPITTPAKPTKFKRSWKKGGKAKLTWKKSKSTAAAPVVGYYVYVNGKKKATLGKGSTSYTAKSLKKGKKYSFSIKARNAVGTSSSAKIASKKRP